MNISDKVEKGFVQESNEDYHGGGGLGATGVVAMLDSPAHFKCGGKGPAAKTAHDGTIIHTALLEPKRFEKNRVLEPDAHWNKAGKIEWFDFFQECDERELMVMSPHEAINLKVSERPTAYMPNVIHVSVAEMEMIEGIKESVYDSEAFSDLLIGTPEESGYLETSEEYDNTIIKTRPDIRTPIRGKVTDIKSTIDARDFLRKDLINYKYHVKAAWYLDICNALEETTEYFEFVWLVVEKTPPFGVMAYRMDITSDEFKEGRHLGLKALAEYRDCKRANHWPCYDDKIRRAEFPKWYKNRIIES
jgi:hypothetical protein